MGFYRLAWLSGIFDLEVDFGFDSVWLRVGHFENIKDV
jgi:hypothetical protein